ARHRVPVLSYDDAGDETLLSRAVESYNEPPAFQARAAEQPNLKLRAYRRVALVFSNLGREPLLRHVRAVLEQENSIGGRLVRHLGSQIVLEGLADAVRCSARLACDAPTGPVL